MAQVFTNNATSKLSTLLTISGTTAVVETGAGAKFASPTGGDYQLATLDDGTNIEIVKIISRSTDSLTIVRAQEGTSAREWPVGTPIEGRLTAGSVTGLVKSTATGGNSIAIGFLSEAAGEYATAIAGGKANGDYSLAMQGGKTHDIGVAIGSAARVYSRDTWNISGIPTIPRDDYTFGNERARDMIGLEAYFATSWADLGNVPPWAATTSYTDGDVVRPTAGGSKQMHLYIDDYPASTGITSGGAEPSWDLSDYGWTDDSGFNGWITTDPSSGYLYSLNTGILFFVTEIGFICFKHANVTAAPYISVGDESDANRFVNNQQLTGITGAGQLQRFAITDKTAMTSASGFKFKVNTKATGTNSQFLGRWYVRGFAINSQGNV